MTAPMTREELADELERCVPSPGGYVLVGADERDAVVVALRAGVAQTVPSGWRLVPDRPTQRQMDAGLYQSSADSTWSDVYSIYADMIDAAPSIDDRPDDVKPVAAPPSNQGASK